MKLRCLIVDDEPVAREGLREYIMETDYLEAVGVCENALKASTFLNDGLVDLMLLDIQMPKLSGVDFLKTLRNPPLVILTTAFSEYAIESYSLDVVDYLVKPIPIDRFLKATQKALEIYQLRRMAAEQKASMANYFFVKSDGKYEKVNLSEIGFIESLQNYVIIHIGDRKLITYMTLSGLENQLPADKFMKVHKSYIVSISNIKSIDGNEILIGSARIPISRSLREFVVSKIVGNNLFKR